MTDKVREQILKVRETGKTNMFDIYTVQRIGLKMGFYDMVIFILHGDEKGRVEQNKTRFAKDYATVLEWDPEAEEIIKRRKEEITRLKQEGRSCRNGFRMKCIQQELERLEHELEILVDLL